MVYGFRAIHQTLVSTKNFHSNNKANTMTSNRLEAIDLMRGFVMIVMALDHTRIYWGLTPYDPTDLTQASPELFLTRWVTHLCAPVFVFLTGLSAYLYGKKVASKKALSRYLLSRGLWLIFLEVTLVNFSWTFQIGGPIGLQVIWAIGVAMLFLAAFIWLPKNVLFVISLAIIAGHNLLDPITTQPGQDWHWLWALLHQQAPIFIGQQLVIFVAYPVLPWIALMALGYLLADSITQLSARQFLIAGASLVAVFILIRLFTDYGDANHWTFDNQGHINTVLSFINLTKYPPSLLFLMITLGFSAMIMSSFHYWPSAIKKILLVFGRVPLFFYLIHIAFIHATMVIWYYIQHQRWLNYQWNSTIADYEPSLLNTYLVWSAAILVLYIPCRWHYHLKATSNHPILKYL